MRRSDLAKVHSDFIYLLIFLFTPILIVKLRLIPKYPGSGPGHQGQVALGGHWSTEHVVPAPYPRTLQFNSVAQSDLVTP